MRRAVPVALLLAAACAPQPAEDDTLPPAPPAVIERSLVWTQSTLLDDEDTISLKRVLRTFADDGHGGVLLDRWFHRFGTTAHSERLGPVLLVEDFADLEGPAPETWDLDLFPFEPTAIHNRIDLADRSVDGHCGELRVSFASTDPVYAPFHLIFLFRQPAQPDDIGKDGVVHCRGTGHRWADLSALPEDEFYAAARDLLDTALVPENVVLAESVEATVQPWEWRQWRFVDTDTLDNQPMFQTVDTERLNAPGPDRDAFLAWVNENAADIDARTILIPESFRPLSARVTDGIPRPPLDLTGIDAGVAAEFTDLAGNLEIVGCPACHTTDANFVQTRPDRTFSEFYEKELDARQAFLDDLNSGLDPPVPFGPLQPDPVLP